MTYKTEKFYLSQSINSPSQQTISNTYQEISGSKCNITLKKQSIDLMYKFCFLTSQIYISSSNYDKTFIHIKLQKSNDDFSSNIVDIPGKQFNFSGDTVQASDFYYKTCNVFFIVENLDSDYLRLVARSYSTSNKTNLHENPYWDGSSASDVYYNPTLVVAEI